MTVFQSNSPHSLRVIFMGSPSPVVPVLEKLVGSPLIEVVLVVTAPSETPVKKRAQELNLEIYAPKTLKQDNKLIKYQPDLIFVSAYGKLIPKEILDLPKYGCLNIHPSLLPKYRGPAPGQAAILAGEKASGVTVMLVDEGFDTGPILAQKEIPLTADETAESFYDKAFREGAGLLLEVLPCYVEYVDKGILRSPIPPIPIPPFRDRGQDDPGTSLGIVPRIAQNDGGGYQIFTPPQPQNHLKATYSEKFTRESGRIDWDKPDEYIERMIRAFYPWPGAWCTVGELMESFFRRHPEPEYSGEGSLSSSEISHSPLGRLETPREILRSPPNRRVPQNDDKTGKRVKILKAHLNESRELTIDRLQIEGKKPISWEEFERGYVVGD